MTVKTQRKANAETVSYKVKSAKKNRGAPSKTASKLNGKHPLAAYEHLHVGVVQSSLDGKYTDVNEEFCRILGHSKKELLQLGVKDCTYEEDYALDLKLHEQLVNGKIPFYGLEKRLVRKDGQIIWVELTCSLVRDAHGKALGTIGIVIDISEYKKVEKVLRESAENLRIATEAARMFKWELDLQKQLYTFSDNFVHVLGFSAGLLPQNSVEVVWKLSPEEDVRTISEAIAKAIEDHSDLHSLQYRLIDPESGQTVWLEANAKVVYDERGNAQRMFGVAQNITANKNAQEEIWILSKLPEENPNPVMRLTPDGKVLYANHSSQDLLEGWKRQAHQTIPDELKKHLAATFASGKKQEIEITQNGKTFACTLAPIREAGYVNLYGTDITERKQIAQELTHERELLASLFEAIPVMLTIYEPSTEVLRLNSQFEKTIGWSSQDAAGMSLMEACYPDAEYRAKVGEFMESCVPNEWMDIRMQTRAGRTLETSWSNIRLSSDTQVGIGIDITERKQMENALRAKEAELQEVINRTPFMLTRCSRDLRYRFVSDAYARMIGRTPEEVAGKSILEIMGEEGLKTISPYVERVLQGEQVEYETEVPFTGVGAPSLHVIYTPDWDERGNVIGWFASIIDITERKRSERALAEFARQQAALYQLSDQLHHTQSLEDVYNAALDAILNGLQCHHASILLFDDTNVMRFVAWRGLSDEYRQATEGHSPWGPDEKNPYPVCVSSIPSSDFSDSLNTAIQKEGIGSLVFIPLMVDGKLIGKFMVYFNEPHECNDVEIELSLMIGRQLASGIERRRAEEQLRASETLYRTIARSIPGGGVYVVDQDFRYLVAEGPTTEAFGLSREMLEGRTVWDVFPDERGKSMTDRLERTFAGETVDFETEHQGHTYWTRQAPLRDSLGQAIIVTLDITERKRAEEALKKENERFMRFVDSNIVGILIGDASGKVVLANDYYLRLLGLSRQDFVDGEVDWKKFTPPEWLSADEKAIQQLRERGVCDPYEKEYIRTDGTRVPVYVADAMLPGSEEEIAAFVLDITERKRAEEALARERELLERLFETMPVMVSMYDPETDSLRLNAEFERLIGWKTGEVTVLSLLESIYPDPEYRMQVVQRMATAGRNEWVDVQVQARDGRMLDSAWSNASILNGRQIGIGIDLTERKRAGEALRQSEERFARFMQHLPGLAWIKDIQGRYMYANAAAEKAFNTPRDRLYGKTDLEIFPVEIATQFKKNDELALVNEKGTQTIEILPQEDGVVHYSLVTKFPIPSLDGSATLIGGTAFDITERLQAEEALRESEERFKAILSQATAGIVRKDAEGRLIFVNEAFCEMLDYTETEMLGKTIWDFMHPEDIAEHKRLFERLMEQGLPFRLERRFVRRDGSLLWVDASVSPLMDADGKPHSAVAVEVDITGRMQAEEALQQMNLQLESRVQKRTATIQAINQSLREEIAERKRIEEALRVSEALARESEEKLRTLFDLLPAGISFLDPEGKIIRMNSALPEILKLSKEQLFHQGYKSRRYIRADGTPMPATEFAGARALAEEKTIYNVETGIVLENGETIWTSVSAAPVDVAEVGVVVVTVDITEKKRAEQALQESHARLRLLSQRLVEVQEEERRALARELHDRVGQTLAALNINLIIINSQLSAELVQQIGARLNDSMKLVGETIALVRDVMTDLRPAVLDDYGLEAALEAHLGQYSSRYNSIKTTFEKPQRPIPRLGPSVEMTLLRIVQEALMNIAKHAHAEHINLSLRQEGQSVCLTIQDDGIGIESRPEAHRPGSHGLTIMRERAEAFGGTLKVNSIPGRGTIIEAVIPFKNDPQIQTQEEQRL